MARLERVVVPGIPHHVVQRGNRRQDVFFNNGFVSKIEKKLKRVLQRDVPGRPGIGKRK